MLEYDPYRFSIGINIKLGIANEGAKEMQQQRLQALFAQLYIYKKYCKSQLKLRGRCLFYR